MTEIADSVLECCDFIALLVWPVNSALLEEDSCPKWFFFYSSQGSACCSEGCLTVKKGRVCHSFDPEGFELSTGFYRSLLAGHHAVRHGRLQGIPNLNIASCKWKKKQNVIGVKTDGWGEAAEDLTHTWASVWPLLSVAQLCVCERHHFQSSNRD